MEDYFGLCSVVVWRWLPSSSSAKETHYCVQKQRHRRGVGIEVGEASLPPFVFCVDESQSKDCCDSTLAKFGKS